MEDPWPVWRILTVPSGATEGVADPEPKRWVWRISLTKYGLGESCQRTGPPTPLGLNEMKIKAASATPGMRGRGVR